MVEDLIKKANILLSSESRDGRAINIVLFSKETVGKIKSGDLSKAESANKVLENLIADASKAVKEICDFRTSLFDKDMNVKSWKANEMKFLDSCKINLENIIRSAEKIQSSIITNVNVLKRKINPQAEKTAEEKRKKRRVTESKRRSAKERRKRLIVKGGEVIKLITKGKLSLDDLRKDNAEKLIQLSDLETDTKLVPRYHHKAVLWLIEEKLFEPAALAFVQSLADKMQANLGKAFQRNKEKKEKHLKSKPQRTIFQWFSPTADNSETSPDESETSQSEASDDSDS